TKVTYLRGNHDDFLEQFLPLTIGNLKLVRDMVYVGANGKRYLVTHGDIFDSVTSKWTWLAHVGDVGYTFLLWLNRIYNKYRESRGLPYYSLSKVIKAKVKTAVSYISNYEEKLVQLARSKQCAGVICGHIHQPIITQYNDITYLNSGDWVESLSALVEDFSGEWSLVYFADSKKVDMHTLAQNSKLDEDDDEDFEVPAEFVAFNKKISA
ncbi:MAG: UDP-2,3-diacylglucosamine diphosphatase, partial [Bacteroidetes bacterium]